ncbi:hypothetical protein [Ruegeria profundi]|uniref:hypothetical protein n=1 Tax=Ruegeria profundi TaxID=1685378 RepID=UPI001CD754DE|nr:hypothetical protein [Ruegeria profundi]MCA0929559.1 hypothetical protein [Ruegeria profundi]
MAYLKAKAAPHSQGANLTTLKACILVLCFAVMQTVPAAINGFPFIFFDTRGYNNAGKAVVETIAGKQWVDEAPVTKATSPADPSVEQAVAAAPGQRVISMSRSPYYGALVFVSLQAEALLLVLFQSLIVGYVAWLVVRQICKENPTKPYLVIGVICAAVTPLPYFTAYAMPDVFAAVVPLCLFLLCVSKRSLTKTQIVICWVILAAAVAIHSSHILLTFGLLVLLALMSLWPRVRPLLSGWLMSFLAFSAGVSAVFAFAFVSQAVFGSWPQNLPFLTARGIEDGPVAELMANDCGGYEFAICDAAPLDNNSSQLFLWDKNGYYQSADEATKQRLSDEDFSVFLTAALAEPVMQIRASVGNALRQLGMFGLYEFYTAKRVFAESAPHFMNGSNLSRFGASLAVTGGFPFIFLSTFVYASAVISLITVAIMFGVRSISNTAMALAVLILATLLINAVVCGVLSDPHHRYQARVIWLLPFLATLLVFQGAQRAKLVPTQFSAENSDATL